MVVIAVCFAAAAAAAAAAGAGVPAGRGGEIPGMSVVPDANNIRYTCPLARYVYAVLVRYFFSYFTTHRISPSVPHLRFIRKCRQDELAGSGGSGYASEHANYLCASPFDSSTYTLPCVAPRDDWDQWLAIQVQVCHYCMVAADDEPNPRLRRGSLQLGAWREHCHGVPREQDDAIPSHGHRGL